MKYKVPFTDLGQMEYGSAWDYQENIQQQVISNKDDGNAIPGQILFCEHPHVYTLGKSGVQENLLISDEFLNKINATFYKSNRGGDITYHGPGQIVGYPMLDLQYLNLGVKEYIHRLEEAIILLLAEYGITSERFEGATGVWLDVDRPTARKICAIGVKVSKAVTMHGFALNVNTDLAYFGYINPCGFTNKGVTSMEKEIGEKQDFGTVQKRLLYHISEVFHIAVE